MTDEHVTPSFLAKAALMIAILLKLVRAKYPESQSSFMNDQ